MFNLPKKRMSILTLTIMFVFCFSNLLAKENTPKKKAVASNEPIQVVSDRLEAFDAQKLVVFSGNAVAVRGDVSLKSDSISLYYKKDNKAPKAKTGNSLAGGGDLERIESKGHVVVTQGPKVVTGELAIFYQDEQKIVMTGNPVMREGSNKITGCRIVVFVDENRGMVEPCDNKRVSATIYPSEKSDGKSKKGKK